MPHLLRATALAALSTTALAHAASAEAVAHTLDPNHSIVEVSWTHGEFSTTSAVFFGVTGDIMFDSEEPANSSVSVSMPLQSVATIEELKNHLMSDDFFGENADSAVTFESTGIEVTGEDTATITGNLTLNGVTNEVMLDATLNGVGEGPRGGTIAGFDATTTVMRSDYDLGMFVPFVSDEMQVEISIEASPAEG